MRGGGTIKLGETLTELQKMEMSLYRDLRARRSPNLGPVFRLSSSRSTRRQVECVREMHGAAAAASAPTLLADFLTFLAPRIVVFVGGDD